MDTPPKRRNIGLAVLISLAALAYSVMVIGVAASAPDKGMFAFTGRRIVAVEPGGPADRAGIRPGDVIAEIDGKPVLSTADYIDRLLRRSPGETVEIGVRRDGAIARFTIELETSPFPWFAMAATFLALMLLALGLIARIGRPDDVAAVRFWRTTVVFALIYAGALSWTHLLIHPLLLAVFACTLFFASPLVVDFALVFPVKPDKPARRRALIYAPSIALLAGLGVAAWWAVSDFQAQVASDRALRWVVRLVALVLVLAALETALALISQYRRIRTATGAERSQLRWLMFGHVVASVPMFAAIPVAVAGLDKFLLVHFRPFVIAAALLWFAANALAVLRIRLADVSAIIHRSVVYAAASGGAVAIYLGVVLAVGVVAEEIAGSTILVPHLIAAVTAAALFGPLQRRVTRWLDRRFFRDRLHYVAAVRELTEAIARIQEPADLASEVVTRSVEALRASSGALYLGDDFALADSAGGDYPASIDPVSYAPPEDGLVVPIEAHGVLVLGPRRDGELYSSEDRDLLAALAGQLAISLDNAEAFGTIAELGRTLEAQNAEIRELRDRLEDENLYLKRRLASDATDEIVGSSRAIRELRRTIERVARSEAIVLITGESGTGKGLIARSIHAASERASAPFIQVDCGAIPAQLIESELFGHERGAFTGAVRRRRGHFELADGGTLFLDEIGELPLELQPRLLRVLQERSFMRVGGDAEVSVDVRIVAATNVDLEEAVAAGRFREDLLYRLRVVELAAVPLRRRTSDIGVLVEHLLPELCRRNHRKLLAISDAALETLTSYGWPGNVRELANVLERAVVLCEGRTIEPGDLNLADSEPGDEQVIARLGLADDASHDQIMAAFEKQRLESALKIAGNQSRAARRLGMARTTFINKLRRYELL